MGKLNLTKKADGSCWYFVNFDIIAGRPNIINKGRADSAAADATLSRLGTSTGKIALKLLDLPDIYF